MLPNSTTVLPVSNITIPFALFETVPIIYLIILSFMDYQYSFNIRTHFFPIISEIRDKMNNYRRDAPTGSCPTIGTPSDNCPITHSLETHHGTINQGQSEIHGDDLWTTIRKGFVLQNQATYFEIIIIQFFVLFLVSSNYLISFFGFFAAVIMFAGPYVGSTYIQKTPVTLFQYGNTQIWRYNIPNGIVRILLVVIILVFTLVLLSM